jgi:predicted PurR-regulated permease PerM
MDRTGWCPLERRAWVALVVTVAALYLARDVLIPVALAALLTSAGACECAPRHFGVGRGIATLLVTVFAFSVIGAIGLGRHPQAVSLAAKLPEYGQTSRKISRGEGTGARRAGQGG